MNVTLLRVVDRWIGAPICFLLTLWSAVFRRRPKSRAPREVLFIQLSEMGSLALAYPAVREMRQRFPEARVHFLVFERNRNFLELIDLVDADNVWTIDDTCPFRFIRSVLRFRKEARRRGVDTAIDYEIFSRASMILSWLSGAARRVGFDNYRAEGLYRGRLLTHPIAYNVYHHISVNFIAMVRALGEHPLDQPALKQVIEADLSLPKRAIDPERAASMRERIAEAAHESWPEFNDTTRVVVLSPFSGNLLPIRAWPVENYVAFLDGLFAQTDDTIALVIGLPESTDYCRPIFEGVGNPRLVDFIGRTADIAELIDLFSVCDLFVTTDSGPPHFASMTDIPTIVMFGPECPALYGPLGANVASLTLDMHCSPCVNAFNHRDTPCRDSRCMTQIKSEKVLEMALGRLGAK